MNIIKHPVWILFWGNSCFPAGGCLTVIVCVCALVCDCLCMRKRNKVVMGVCINMLKEGWEKEEREREREGRRGRQRALSSFVITLFQDWREVWLRECFWHVLFAFILLIVMIIWRPSANRNRYTILVHPLQVNTKRKCETWNSTIVMCTCTEEKTLRINAWKSEQILYPRYVY